MEKKLVNIGNGKVYILDISRTPSGKNHYQISEETIPSILYTVIYKTEDIECLESYLRTRLLMDNNSIKEVKTKEIVEFY